MIYIELSFNVDQPEITGSSRLKVTAENVKTFKYDFVKKKWPVHLTVTPFYGSLEPRDFRANSKRQTLLDWPGNYRTSIEKKICGPRWKKCSKGNMLLQLAAWKESHWRCGDKSRHLTLTPCTNQCRQEWRHWLASREAIPNIENPLNMLLHHSSQ